MRFKLNAFLGLLCFTVLFMSQSISNAIQIVAIVGDSVITDYEVSQRARIIALLRDYDINDSNFMKMLEKELVPLLIDEQIKKDYAKRLNISVPKNVIDSVVEDYSKKIGRKNVSDLRSYLSSNGIDWDVFLESISDEITWSNILFRGIANNVKINENEVVQRAKMRNININDESLLSQIKEEIINEKASLSASKLISQMKKLHVIESMR